MNDVHKQESIPAMRMNRFFDAILSNPINLGQQASKMVMLYENAWMLVDVMGMPLWGMA
jgi:hypothetical protein